MRAEGSDFPPPPPRPRDDLFAVAQTSTSMLDAASDERLWREGSFEMRTDTSDAMRMHGLASIHVPTAAWRSDRWEAQKSTAFATRRGSPGRRRIRANRVRVAVRSLEKKL